MVRLHAAGRPPEAFAVRDLPDGAYSGVSAIA